MNVEKWEGIARNCSFSYVYTSTIHTQDDQSSLPEFERKVKYPAKTGIKTAVVTAKIQTSAEEQGIVYPTSKLN